MDNLAPKVFKETHPVYGQLRYLPEKFFSPSSILVYEDNVAIIIWAETPIATKIHSKDVAEAYRYYFEALWKLAKP